MGAAAERLRWLEQPLPKQQAAALAAAMIDELAATPHDQRPYLVDAAKLPVSAIYLGAAAVPLLRALLDDPAVSPHFADSVVRVLLSLDAQEALPSALARARDANTFTLLQALEFIDPGEVYDVVEERLFVDPMLRLFLPRQPRLIRDDRFADLALRLMQTDPAATAALLAALHTPRALEELLALSEVSDAFHHAAQEALLALPKDMRARVADMLEALAPGHPRLDGWLIGELRFRR